MTNYDAVLLIAFGGPDRMEDVRPFLANVLRGRPAPPERVEAVVVESKAILAHLKQSSTAVDAVPPAHDEIRRALDRDDRGPLEKLTALVAEVQRLQKYYSSLK